MCKSWPSLPTHHPHSGSSSALFAHRPEPSSGPPCFSDAPKASGVGRRGAMVGSFLHPMPFPCRLHASPLGWALHDHILMLRVFNKAMQEHETLLLYDLITSHDSSRVRCPITPHHHAPSPSSSSPSGRVLAASILRQRPGGRGSALGIDPISSEDSVDRLWGEGRKPSKRGEVQ